MAPIDLNLLSLFGIVAETASFSEAARKLGMPRSSVSRGVGALEEALGVQLFNRTTRKVALSTAGVALHERIGPQLAALTASLGSLPERDQMPSGELRVSAAPDLGDHRRSPSSSPGSPSAIRRSASICASPRVLVDLVAEGFDVGLRMTTRRLNDSSLVARRLSALELALYAAPAYVARRPPIRTPADTAAHDWVWFRGTPTGPPFPKPERRARVSGDEMLFVYRAVVAGVGIGLFPAFSRRPMSAPAAWCV